MIDTVLLKAHEPLSERAISNLDSAVEDVDAKTGEVLRTKGFVRNLRVTSTPTETTIAGSLTKAVLGHNFGATTPDQMAGLLADLEGALYLDMMGANVYRLDIGLCLTTPFPLAEVIPMCGPLKRYEQDVYRNGRTGVNYILGKQRALLIYDKVAELMSKNRKSVVPPGYKDQHVTRIELQLKKKLKDKSQLGREVFGSMLTETGFHLLLLRRLREEFGNILWVSRPTSGIGENWSEYRDLLAFDGIEARGGANAEISRIRSARKDGAFKSQHAPYRIERGVRDLVGSRTESQSGVARDFETLVSQRLLAHQDLLKKN